MKHNPTRGRQCRLLAWLSVLLLGLALWGQGIAGAQAAEGAVYLLEVEGVINPPVANYIERGLQRAAAQDAALVVIRLDTPGGLADSMRRIDQAILASPVPVATYVAPAGARAASAGLFILMASHIAAMAPGTNTGAAHPVGIAGGEADEVQEAKVVNDAAANIRALATQRGRNADWAEQAVRESVSVTAQEALDLNVIDLVAAGLEGLLADLDGQQVETATGNATLSVAGAPVVDIPMTFGERFLHIISDPNIAYILLTVGSIGLIAELYSPGTFIPGVTGAISLILAFFALGNLPTNWAGVALIVLAVLLFVAELNVEGTGALGVGAVVAFLLGGLILFQPFEVPSPAVPSLRVNPWLIGATTLGMAGLVLWVLSHVLRSRREPVHTGQEAFVGQLARVREELNPRGRVFFEGQLWYARLYDGAASRGPVPAGAPVRIVGIEGLTLIVEPFE